MRSPFLQTVYFEYYVRFSSVDEKAEEKCIQAHNSTKVKLRKKVFGFSVSNRRRSGIDHISTWGPNKNRWQLYKTFLSNGNIAQHCDSTQVGMKAFGEPEKHLCFSSTQ